MTPTGRKESQPELQDIPRDGRRQTQMTSKEMKESKGVPLFAVDFTKLEVRVVLDYLTKEKDRLHLDCVTKLREYADEIHRDEVYQLVDDVINVNDDIMRLLSNDLNVLDKHKDVVEYYKDTEARKNQTTKKSIFKLLDVKGKI